MKSGYTARTSNDGRAIILRIEEWPEGFYLFHFREGESISFRDELQDSLEIAMQAGEEDYGLSRNAWVEEDWERTLR